MNLMKRFKLFQFLLQIWFLFLLYLFQQSLQKTRLFYNLANPMAFVNYQN